ncbi:MAG: staygreen family protein [Promethearchaeota archaeon]
MTELNPSKLHVVYKDRIDIDKLQIPRKYTLTHSDATGDLFLTIGSDYDNEQISGFYTKFMRDEVLAEWQEIDNEYELHFFLHVSGGLCFGWAGMRDKIFRHHLPLVLQAIKYGDKELFDKNPSLNDSKIIIHFQSKRKKYDKIENFGRCKEIQC